jgi:hypothetical protein
MEKQLDKAINKTYNTFWICRGIFGKTWGLKAKVVYWLYTAVVRPIVTYPATIWWSRVKHKISQAERGKLQRMVCLGITGAMRIAPTAAMEVVLELPPLHLQVEAEARIGNYRLLCNDQWKPKSEGFGHAYMTHDMKKEPILQMRSDKMVPRNFMKNPSRSEFLIEVNGERGLNPTERGD